MNQQKFWKIIYSGFEGGEQYDQYAKFNQNERAKMILDILDNEPEMQR